MAGFETTAGTDCDVPHNESGGLDSRGKVFRKRPFTLRARLMRMSDLPRIVGNTSRLHRFGVCLVPARMKLAVPRI